MKKILMVSSKILLVTTFLLPLLQFETAHADPPVFNNPIISIEKQFDSSIVTITYTDPITVSPVTPISLNKFEVYNSEGTPIVYRAYSAYASGSKITLSFNSLPEGLDYHLNYIATDPTCTFGVPCYGGLGIYAIGGVSPYASFSGYPVVSLSNTMGSLSPSYAYTEFNKVTVKYGGTDFLYPIESNAISEQFILEEINYALGQPHPDVIPTAVAIVNGSIELTLPNIDFSKDYTVSYEDRYASYENCVQSIMPLDCPMAFGYVINRIDNTIIPSFNDLPIISARAYTSNNRITPSINYNYNIEPFARSSAVTEPFMTYFGEISPLKASSDLFISQNPFIKNLSINTIITRSPNNFTFNKMSNLGFVPTYNDPIHILASDRSTNILKALSVSIPADTNIYNPEQLINTSAKPIDSVKIQSLAAILSPETAPIGTNIFKTGIDIPTVMTLGVPTTLSLPLPADPTSTTFSKNITICVSGDVTSFGTSDVSKIKIYSSNSSVSAATLDSTVNNKQFSLGGQFCFDTNHLTKFLVTVEPTIVVISSGGGGGGGGGGATTTPPVVTPPKIVISGSCKDINFPSMVNQKSKGTVIRELEKFIQKFYFKSLIPDSYYKVSTISAIKLIQKKNKLEVTGFINKETSDYFKKVFCK